METQYKALSELDRVCRKGGRIIISTYKKFIEEAGYKNVDYSWIERKIPCAVAVIKNKKCGNDAKYYIKKMRKYDNMRNKNLRKGRYTVFKRKIYSKMQEWKKDSNGKTALLIEGECVNIGLNQEKPYK